MLLAAHIEQKSQRIGAGERFSELFNVAASCFKSPRVRLCPALLFFYSSERSRGRQPGGVVCPLRPKISGHNERWLLRVWPQWTWVARTRADGAETERIAPSGVPVLCAGAGMFLGTAAR
jgi:hypothetical protein